MSGIGNINNAGGIAYTDMTGLGLTAATQDQVKLDAEMSDSMSQDIIAALAQFRSEGNLNPSSAEMEARLSVAGTSGLTAHQWLTKEMGAQSPHDSYSLQQWGEIAQKLQVNAAKKRSELAIGNGGGIQQVNGQYFVNGQEMSLSQVNFCVRANQYQLIDQQIADQMGAIQRNSEKAKHAQDVLAAIKSYDGENINMIQSATMSAEYIDGQGGGSWGMVQHYLNNNFGVTATSTPNYADYQKIIATGNSMGWSENQVTTLNNLTSWVTGNDHFRSLGNSTGSGTLAQVFTGLTTTSVNNAAPWDAASAASDLLGVAAHAAIPNIASNLGLCVAPNWASPTYAQITNALATYAPTFTPPSTLGGWSAQTFSDLSAAVVAQHTKAAAAPPDMVSNIKSFFSTIKDVDPTFYNQFITDANGGPPYRFAGTISNSDYNNLKTAFGTYFQSNSTDNQVAQQRLEALNNSRQAILDGMSAFTQGQAQVTDRIGGNL